MFDKFLDRLSYRAQTVFLVSMFVALFVSCVGNGLVATWYVLNARSAARATQATALPAAPAPVATSTVAAPGDADRQEPPRPAPLADDVPDSGAIAELRGRDGLMCFTTYCTTADDRLLFIFPNTERDAVVIGRPSELQYVHDMVDAVLGLRRLSGEAVHGFLEREVVTNLCGSPRALQSGELFEVSRGFDGYRLTVRFTRTYDRPDSGWACFVFVEHSA